MIISRMVSSHFFNNSMNMVGNDDYDRTLSVEIQPMCPISWQASNTVFYNLNACIETKCTILTSISFPHDTQEIQILIDDYELASFVLNDDADREISLNIPLYLVDNSLMIRSFGSVSPIVATFTPVAVSKTCPHEREEGRCFKVLNYHAAAMNGSLCFGDFRKELPAWTNPAISDVTLDFAALSCS